MIVVQQTPEPNEKMKMLTPWWDLVTRYLTGIIMTIALTTVALQAAKDSLICIPALPSKGSNSTPINDSAAHVVTKLVDRRHYDFVESLCFQKELQTYPCYFPFFLVGMAAFLLAVNNIWVLFPKTGSVLHHFATLTLECYSAVGTNLDIFRVLKIEKSKSDESEEHENTPGADTELNYLGKSKDQGHDIQLPGDKNFDLKDAMALKSLYEKVHNFNHQHGGERRLICFYIIQTVLGMLVSSGSLALLIYHYNQLYNMITCQVEEKYNIPYKSFHCSRFIAPYYRAVTWIFGAAMTLFLLISVGTMFWTIILLTRTCCTFRKNIYSDVKVDYNIDISGDIAFLYSLLEQYNKLYCDRLDNFLSQGHKAVLEQKIIERIHNTQGT